MLKAKVKAPAKHDAGKLCMLRRHHTVLQRPYWLLHCSLCLYNSQPCSFHGASNNENSLELHVPFDEDTDPAESGGCVYPIVSLRVVLWAHGVKEISVCRLGYQTGHNLTQVPP